MTYANEQFRPAGHSPDAPSAGRVPRMSDDAPPIEIGREAEEVLRAELAGVDNLRHAILRLFNVARRIRPFTAHRTFLLVAERELAPYLEGPDEGMDGRVLDYLKTHPGAGARQLRQIEGRNPDIDASIQRLVEDGKVEDRGSESRRAYYRCPAPGTPCPAMGTGAGVPRVGQRREKAAGTILEAHR